MRIEGILDRTTTPSWKAYADYRQGNSLGQGETADPTLTADPSAQSAKQKRVNDTSGCETCKERTYQDGSNDPGVSFKSPTRVAPEQAASAVRGHEMEHVGREQSKAARENREVVSQTVTYRNGICNECGKSYVAGGTTRTVTRGKQQQQPQPSSGSKLDLRV